MFINADNADDDDDDAKDHSDYCSVHNYSVWLKMDSQDMSFDQ